MKKKKKKVLTVIATIAIICITLTGCGAKMAPADETISALFELTAKSNAAPMKDLLGFTSEEDVYNTFFEEGSDTKMIDELRSQFAEAGIELSDEEIQEYTDSMMATFGKINYSSEITSESSDQIVVTLEVYGYFASDLYQVSADAQSKMLERISEDDQIAVMAGDTEILSKYMQQYFEEYLAGLSTLKLSTEPVKITVNCEKLAVDVNGKETVAWLPSDMNKFSKDIEAAIFQ